MDNRPPDLDLTRPLQLRQEVLRAKVRRLAMQGLNAREASNALGLAHSTVLKIYSDPTFRRDVLGAVDKAFEGVDNAVAERNLTMYEKLSAASQRAFEELVGMMEDSGTPKPLKARICQDFMDRNPETQAGSTVRYERFDPEQLQLAAKVAGEMDNVIPMPPRKVANE